MTCFRRRKNNKTRTGKKSTWCGRHVRTMTDEQWTYASKYVTCNKCKIAVRHYMITVGAQNALEARKLEVS